MNPSSAKTLVFVSGGLLVGLALLSRKGDTYKRVWAAGLWTTGLAVVADLAPQVIGPFALLVIVAAVAADQGVLGSFLAGNEGNTTVTPSKGSKSANADAASRGGGSKVTVNVGSALDRSAASTGRVGQ